MSNLKLEVSKRSDKGTTYARQIRNQGLVPAVLYGRHMDQNIHLTVNGKDFEHKIKHSEAGSNTIFELVIDDSGKKTTEPAIPHRIQRDPLTDAYLNIDFYQVNLKEKITAKVPIQLTNQPPIGVKDGGQMLELVDEIEIHCLPNDLPPHIDIDVSGLDVGQEIRVNDLNLSDKLEILNLEDDQIIVRVEEVHEVVIEEGPPEEGETAVAGEEESAESDKEAEGGSSEETSEEGSAEENQG